MTLTPTPMLAVSDQFWWYTSRSAGITAWVLTAVAVMWGLFLSTGLLRGRPSRPWLLDLHRFLGALSVVFVLIHMAALVADNFVHFDLVDLLVPMASEWQPGAVAWGVVAFWLLMAVQITSLLRRRLVSERIWRTVHASSFILFGTGTVHAFQAGTDVDKPAVYWGGVVITATVLLLSWWRVLAGRRTASPSRARPTSDTADAEDTSRVVETIHV